MSAKRITFADSPSKIHEIEKAKDFEKFRQLPKFTHVPYAVIHPSPRKRQTPSPPPNPDLQVTSS